MASAGTATVHAAKTIAWSDWSRIAWGEGGGTRYPLRSYAQNAFFNALEWVPVTTSAFAIGFLVVPFVLLVTVPYLWWCAVVLAIQALVGLLGFTLHVWADLGQPGQTLFERVLTGAPPMAPLLFPNLVVLALIALWTWAPHVGARS